MSVDQLRTMPTIYGWIVEYIGTLRHNFFEECSEEESIESLEMYEDWITINRHMQFAYWPNAVNWAILGAKLGTDEQRTFVSLIFNICDDHPSIQEYFGDKVTHHTLSCGYNILGLLIDNHRQLLIYYGENKLDEPFGFVMNKCTGHSVEPLCERIFIPENGGLTKAAIP